MLSSRIMVGALTVGEHSSGIRYAAMVGAHCLHTLSAFGLGPERKALPLSPVTTNLMLLCSSLTLRCKE